MGATRSRLQIAAIVAVSILVEPKLDKGGIKDSGAKTRVDFSLK